MMGPRQVRHYIIRHTEWIITRSWSVVRSPDSRRNRSGTLLTAPRHSWQHAPLPAMLALRLRVHPTLLPPSITLATTSPTLRRLHYSNLSHSMPVHPPFPRPTDWKSAAPSPPTGSITFAAQATLPKLPVLPLGPTLERLKDTLVPIAHSQAELADAQRKIDGFANGIGPELQRRLEEHAQYKPHWLEEWWDDGAYLSYRDSVCRYLLLPRVICR